MFLGSIPAHFRDFFSDWAFRIAFIAVFSRKNAKKRLFYHEKRLFYHKNGFLP
jgi:peptidoglycan biosynthesis protein MviN/MurJ (putative lipid II flippase)